MTSRRASVVGGLAGLVLAIGTLTGCSGTSTASASASSDGSGHDDADITFATAMVPHHAQAIAMARLAADHTQSADIKVLARQIDAEQLPEIVQLRDLLSRWGQPAAPTASGMPAMAGMSGMGDAADADQHMSGPGMMTDQQMRDLSVASGEAFDHLFLRMMIKHHGAGVTMAQTELSDGENADAQQLAQNISDSQLAQTTYMIQMLAQT
jgi:uncharacterized protein (DUF305 family)